MTTDQTIYTDRELDSAIIAWTRSSAITAFHYLTADLCYEEMHKASKIRCSLEDFKRACVRVRLVPGSASGMFWLQVRSPD